jgi:TRAP-type mannitol/chloroaromatic compound transport system permease small subunit
VADALEPRLDDEPQRPAEPRSAAYRLFEHVLMALNSVGSVWIFALMFLICADVLMRDLFNAPINGVSDIAAFSIIGIVFLQLGATVHTNRMTKGDVLLELVSKRSARAGALIEALFLLVGAVMFMLVIRATWPLLTRSIQRNEFFGVEGVFTFPTWPVRVIILVGSAAVVLAYLVKVADQLKRAFEAPR